MREGKIPNGVETSVKPTLAQVVFSGEKQKPAARVRNGFWFPTLKFFYSHHELFRRIFRWVIKSDISNAKSNVFLNIQNIT